MPVSNPNVIDAISQDRATQEVRLTMTEHRDWSDDARQLEDLNLKINSYVWIVESGQLFEHDPSYEGRQVRFDLYCQVRPPDALLNRLSALEGEVRSHGMSFTVRFREEDGTLSCLELR